MTALDAQSKRTYPIKQVGVIGFGQMGRGIAQVLATGGYEVLGFDEIPNAVNSGVKDIEQRLSKAIEKGTLDNATKDVAIKRLRAVSRKDELASVDLIIEAVVEDQSVKQTLFRELDSLCKPETILATNTSSVSITKIAAATKRPEKIIGMHFMNPVPVMKLVEIICGLQTSDPTYETIHDLTVKLGKTPVTAKRDFPGFIVNRILIPMLNEAVFVLMEGIATAEDIDNAMKLGTNQPMGPLALADFVGLDTCLAIARIFHEELGDDKYRPCPLLVKYVEAGWLGKKTGRGFYNYSER